MAVIKYFHCEILLFVLKHSSPSEETKVMTLNVNFRRIIGYNILLNQRGTIYLCFL